MALLRFKDNDGIMYEVPAIKVDGREEDAYNSGLEDGRAEGKAEAETEFSLKHFFAIVTGNGTNTLSVDVPFAPDIVTIQCVDVTESYAGAYYLMNASFFMNNTSNDGGFATMTNEGATASKKFDLASAEELVTIAENNISISGLLFGSKNQYPAAWGEGLRYAVYCEKL